jgi:hypothetical protein
MTIKIFNEFMQKSESDQVIKYIDNNLKKFQSFQENKYFIEMFGKDNYHKSSINLDELGEVKNLVLKYFQKCVEKIKIEYEVDEDLYPSSFWLAKQNDGAYLEIHGDNDYGKNPHIKYTCSIYLNDVFNEGEIHFPYLQYKYQPRCGDLFSFPSQNGELNYDHEIKKIVDSRYTMLIWLGNDKNYALKY